MNLSVKQLASAALAVGMLMSLQGQVFARSARVSSASWKQVLADRLPLYGHRNWICIMDSAYPAQVSPGVETVVSGANQLEVVKAVLKAIHHSIHVRPIIYLDKELKFVPEKDAPGVTAYRRDLGRLLAGNVISTKLHEQLISNLNDEGKTFKVLIIKTNLTIPYTSVFIRLNCKYWPDSAEQRLRAAMAGH